MNREAAGLVPVCSSLSVGEKTIRRLIRDGELRPVTVEGEARVPVAQLRRLLAPIAELHQALAPAPVEPPAARPAPRPTMPEPPAPAPAKPAPAWSGLRLVTLAEAARLFSVPRSRLDRMIASGELATETVRGGSRPHVRTAALRRLLGDASKEAA